MKETNLVIYKLDFMPDVLKACVALELRRSKKSISITYGQHINNILKL